MCLNPYNVFVTKVGHFFFVQPPIWQVRRQRQVEQELTLKDCQKKTEQLQLWLANIAQTLDHVTRINDQSQLEVKFGRRFCTLDYLRL